MRGLLLAVLVGASLSANASGPQCDWTDHFDFEDFRGAGFSPKPASGELDSDVFRAFGLSQGDGEFGEIRNSGDFARGVASGALTETLHSGRKKPPALSVQRNMRTAPQAPEL